MPPERRAMHPILAKASLALLTAVLEEKRVLDRTVQEAFKANPRWGKRDRGFIASSVWECVRWARAHGWVADSRDPAALLAVEWSLRGLELPAGWEWRGLREVDFAARRAQLAEQPRAVRESIPDWLDLRGSSELGGVWDRELAALNRRAPVCLRVNRLVSDRARVLAWLESHGVTGRPVDGSEDAVVLEGLLPKPLKDDGRIELQDPGSQRIAPLLQVEPGMRVIDACAGAGGKTLHLAALMQGRGEIVAMDVNARKLDELRRRAKRAGVKNLRVELWNETLLKRFAGWADRILIDAPCSGLGTLRRQPDLKWRLSEAGLEKTRRLQRKLLDHYPSMLAPGGKWVYATCSLLPSENRGQLDELAARDGRWRVEDEFTTSPDRESCDGFYAARLVAAAGR